MEVLTVASWRWKKVSSSWLSVVRIKSALLRSMSWVEGCGTFRVHSIWSTKLFWWRMGLIISLLLLMQLLESLRQFNWKHCIFEGAREGWSSQRFEQHFSFRKKMKSIYIFQSFTLASKNKNKIKFHSQKLIKIKTWEFSVLNVFFWEGNFAV